MNKKIIKLSSSLLIIVLFGLFAAQVYAYNTKMSDTEYVSTMNNYISEMKENTYHKGGSMWKALIYNVDDSYLIPEIDKLTILKSGVSGLRENIQDFKFKNKITTERHSNVISKCDNIIQLLNQDINAKTEILNYDGSNSDKYNMIKQLDTNVMYNIEKNFYEINTILQNINVENY